MSETSATITISHAIKARLEALGARTEQSPNALAEEAIEQFLEDEAWKQREIQSTLLAVKSETQFISGAAMSAWVESWDTEDEQPEPKADMIYALQCK